MSTTPGRQAPSHAATQPPPRSSAEPASSSTNAGRHGSAPSTARDHEAPVVPREPAPPRQLRAPPPPTGPHGSERAGMKSGVEVDDDSDPGDGAAGLRDGWRECGERVPDLLFVVEELTGGGRSSGGGEEGVIGLRVGFFCTISSDK